MNIKHQDFIGFYRNVYPENYCQHLINEFERLLLTGAGTNRQQGEGAPRHIKSDTNIFLNIPYYSNSVLKFENETIENIFFKGLQICFEDYVEKYSTLKQVPIKASHMKMQRTDPGEGYHIWHAERSKEMADRVMVYILYLNTFNTHQAGETEFLYQKLRVLPEENLLLLWPAGYTHTHRGNVVHGEKSKYIVTGWFFYE